MEVEWSLKEDNRYYHRNKEGWTKTITGLIIGIRPFKINESSDVLKLCMPGKKTTFFSSNMCQYETIFFTVNGWNITDKQEKIWFQFYFLSSIFLISYLVHLTGVALACGTEVNWFVSLIPGNDMMTRKISQDHMNLATAGIWLVPNPLDINVLVFPPMIWGLLSTVLLHVVVPSVFWVPLAEVPHAVIPPALRVAVRSHSPLILHVLGPQCQWLPLESSNHCSMATSFIIMYEPLNHRLDNLIFRKQAWWHCPFSTNHHLATWE